MAHTANGGSAGAPLRIGVDLGGSKIELIALDRIGQTLWRQRQPTPKGDYQATLDTIVTLVQRCEQELGMQGTLGVGIPGVISSQTGRVKNSNSQCLNGHSLDTDLAYRLGRPVRTANDANCFAVSEAMDGAGRGKKMVFGAILGTGCGAGLAINGEAHSGSNGVAGEWGHNPLPWMSDAEFPGPDCFCGKRGCIESYVSGSGLERQFFERFGERLTATEIELKARQADPDALAIQGAYLDQLARSLAHVINILDPDCIVLGGGLSNLDWLYQKLPDVLPHYVIGGECHVPVLRNHHGDASGVRGAAWLWGEL
ncbi:ROK family protein [Ferrimonas pelagia]|uniref:Fructokinase n=1 Tax=Ferrimonas pelagia TaxID=1177826 RepID=A0ABP9ECV5_9GAMM